MIIPMFSSKLGDINLGIPGPASALGTTLGQQNSQLAGMAFGTVGFANMNAITDPGASNDSTQGYQVGSIWFNAAAGFLRWWECRDATAGAAKWVFSGADYANGGTNPPTEQTQFGASTASIAAEGNFFREVLSTANGRSPGATGSGAFYVLATFNIPASAFDGATLPGGTAVGNRGVNIQANGSLGNNGNTKRIVIVANPAGAVLGGTLGGTFGGGVIIADTGPITVNGSGWCLACNIFKYGGPGSNTQLAVHETAQAGGSVFPLLATQNLTLPENAAIPIAVMASCTTAANDVVYNFAEANALN